MPQNPVIPEPLEPGRVIFSRDRELVQAVLDHAAWGGGVVGITPTLAALGHGNVLVLVVDSAVLKDIPALPLLASQHAAHLAPVQRPHAHGLSPYGGMGAILRSASERPGKPVDSTAQITCPFRP